MIENVSVTINRCSSCRKECPIEDFAELKTGTAKTCNKCKERAKKNVIAYREHVVLCSKDGCKFKRSSENIYCLKHELCLLEDQTRELNKKLCVNYIRGCKTQLEMEYKFGRCENCLKKDREKDRQRRGYVGDQNNNVSNVLENTIRTSKYCTTCCRDLPMDQFVGIKNPITKTCKDCRDDNKKQDANRNKEHRNEIARKNEQKPEIKEVRAKWKEENYEKVALTWMNSRQKRIEENTKEYLKKNAENAKQWRENNKEKTDENNENKKNNREKNYLIYKRSADNKNLEFSISYREYVIIVDEPCHYCGIIQDKGFNGIDRKDQTKGYVLDNCVSCCKLCNYMKGSTSDDVFIKRVEHILTFQNKVNGNLYPEYFASHKGCSYNDYKYRALKKQLDFLITVPDYEKIIQGDCFICGKKNGECHKNGIDRMDSTKGYLLDNVNSCCGECNYMKKNYELDDIMNKFMLIYIKHENDAEEDELVNSIVLSEPNINVEIVETNVTEVFEEKLDNKPKIQNTHLVVNKNKKTKEEMREANKLYKQKQRERLKEKYGDEEYKKLRAKEIAGYRAEKKK